MIIICFILSGLSDAVVLSWLVPYQSFYFFRNAETVVTDVALVMGFYFVLLRFVLQILDCCAERRILGVFLIFLVTAVILSII